jgi:hypothetical protein
MDKTRFEKALDRVVREHGAVLKALGGGTSGEAAEITDGIGRKRVAKSIGKMRRRYGKVLKRLAGQDDGRPS